MNIVQDLAGDPAVMGHSRNGGEAHAGGTADDVEYVWHGGDALEGSYVILDIGFHRSDPTRVVSLILS